MSTNTAVMVQKKDLHKEDPKNTNDEKKIFYTEVNYLFIYQLIL